MYINTCTSTSFRELQGIWDCSCSIWRTFKLIRVAGIWGDAGTAGRFWVAWAQFWRLFLWMPAASCLATVHACLTSSVAGRRIRLQRYLIWWGGPQECMELRHLDHPGGWWSPRWSQQWQWQIWHSLWIQDLASWGLDLVLVYWKQWEFNKLLWRSISPTWADGFPGGKTGKFTLSAPQLPSGNPNYSGDASVMSKLVRQVQVIASKLHGQKAELEARTGENQVSLIYPPVIQKKQWEIL